MILQQQARLLAYRQRQQPFIFRRTVSTVQQKLKSTISKKRVVSAGLLESWTKDGVLNTAAAFSPDEIVDGQVPQISPQPLEKKPSSRRKKSKQKETQELILSGDPPPQFISVASQIESRYQDYTESRELVDRYLDENPLPKSDELTYSQQQAVLQFWQSEFAWEESISTTNKEIFNNDVFRPYQQEAVNITMAKKDMLVCLPTGGGKSLCYQLPGLAEKGTTIVVSPLIALIEDQLLGLHNRGIKAVGLSSQMGAKQAGLLYKQMTDPNFDIKFLYLTPERISHSKAFVEALDVLYRNGNLLRIAIDEAHCISEWGHDFRPSYRQLSVFAKRYPGVPIVAVTGTLTPTVRTDIMQQLGIESSAYVLQASFNRTNLWLEVLPRSEEGMSELYNYIINTELSEKTGIIYCMTCREAEELADYLRSKELKAAYYHGSLSNSARSKTQAEWMSGQVKVICTTIAFGLGIDKPDVRYVLHATMPASLEAYYQQVGRAGRDQQLSACAMFYNHKDIYRLKNLIKMGTEEAAQRRALNAEMNVSAESAAAMRLMRKKKKLKQALFDDDGNRIISEEEREAEAVAKAEGRYSSSRIDDDTDLTDEDINHELTIFKEDKLDDVLKFCLDVNKCRRTQLLAYFGEQFDASYCNDTCDVCYRKKLVREAKGDSQMEPKLKRLSRKFANIDPLLQRTLPPIKYQQLRLKSMEEGVSLPQIVAEPGRVPQSSVVSRSDGSTDAIVSDMSPIQRSDSVVHDAISPSIPKLVDAAAGPGPTRIAEMEARQTAAVKELSSDPSKRRAMMGEIRKMARDLRSKQAASTREDQDGDGPKDPLEGHQDPAVGSLAEVDEKNDAPEDDADAAHVDPKRVQMANKNLKQRERHAEKMQLVRQQQAAVSSSSGSAISRQLYEICEEEAQERNVKPRDVLSHVSIKEIVRVRPKSMSELAAIKGVGARKANAIFERVLPLFNDSD